MGSCFSISNSSTTGGSSGTGRNSRNSRNTAVVVLHDGSLREYNCAVPADRVLTDHHNSSSSYFVCSSDELFYDTEIQALGSQQSLQLGQLYFVLPHSKLRRRLSGADMAALAAKASSALDAAAAGGGRIKKDNRRSMIQVMPVSDDDADVLETINGRTTRKISSMASNYKKLDSANAAEPWRRNWASPQKKKKQLSLGTIEELAE